MRHGGGGKFAWWVDTAILNEIAVRYKGKIADDGVGEKWDGVPNKYNDLYTYLDLSFQHCKPDIREHLMQWEMEMIPPEFHNDPSK